jgi:hypothetical protein
VSASEPKLLAGGNPQIPKGDGDGPVQAYIAAMPDCKKRCRPPSRRAGHKNRAGRPQGGEVELALLRHRRPRVVPQLPLLHQVREGDLLQWREAQPASAGRVEGPNTRYFHIHEDGEIDEQQFVDWIKQASVLPGWTAGI